MGSCSTKLQSEQTHQFHNNDKQTQNNLKDTPTRPTVRTDHSELTKTKQNKQCKFTDGSFATSENNAKDSLQIQQLQSHFNWFHTLISGFVRKSMLSLDKSCINTIVAIYKSFQIYSGSIGDTCDLKVNGKWWKIKIKYHKLANELLSNDMTTLTFTKSQRAQEGIQFQLFTNSAQWIFLPCYNVICDCALQCKNGNHIITSKRNKHLQTTIQANIKHNNKQFIEKQIDIKNEFGEWHKAKILRFKSKKELLPTHVTLNKSQRENIHKLQWQIGMYIYEFQAQKDYWIFSEHSIKQITCNCSGQCEKSKHLITEIDNHLKSRMQPLHSIVTKMISGYIRQNFETSCHKFISIDIKRLIISIFNSIKIYNGCVGDACDVYISGEWKVGIIKFHKQIYEPLPDYKINKSNCEQLEIFTTDNIKYMEGICVLIPNTVKAVNHWFFFNDYNEICDCPRQCAVREHCVTTIKNHRQSLGIDEFGYYGNWCIGMTINVKDINYWIQNGRKEYGEGVWRKAIIKEYQSKTQSLYLTEKIYVKYIHKLWAGKNRTRKTGDWMQIEKNSICKCSGKCQVAVHRFAEFDSEHRTLTDL